MINILRNRKSVRHFENKPVSPEHIEIIKEAILRSPSSKNRTPWEFIIIDDRDLLTKLATAKPHGAAFLADAPLGILVCGDENQSDVWIEDCSIASIIAQLTAESLGLGSCWIQIRNRMHESGQTSEAYIQQLLHIPRNVKIESIIALGYSNEENTNTSDKELKSNKIFINRYKSV